MYVVLLQNDEVSSWGHEQLAAIEFAANDGGSIVYSNFQFDPELGYRYLRDQDTFEVYEAPAPSGI
jgi:hypothetical protein